MLGRLAALLFVLVIAGQVSAGMCGCLGGETSSEHRCCKAAKFEGDSFRTKSCCDTDCMARQSEKVPQDRTELTIKIKFKAVFEPLASETVLLTKVTARSAFVAPLYWNDRLKYARPPALYLRHHAFLI
jgi:hypothetical protein